MELVIVGSSLTIKHQSSTIRKLLARYSLPGPDKEVASIHAWMRRGKRCQFGCMHLEVPLTVQGATTDARTKRFMRAAMKLGGVYTKCPEHTKRRFWNHNVPHSTPFVTQWQ
jgi:hypothetical protein